MRPRAGALALALLALVETSAAATKANPPAPASSASSPAPASAKPLPKFTDVTKSAGISFVHNSGRTGKKYLPESLGSGCAFLDADGDGWLDIFLVNSRDWTPGAKKSLSALYRNDGKGHFTDITAGSGLDVELYGLGVAIGDYDNDGRDDLYLTAIEGDRLFQNLGGGKFRDVTAASGIRNTNFGTSAAWLDYDRDGRLDLFVANYVEWSIEKDVFCSLDGQTKSYCPPTSFKPIASRLFRNLGSGKFEDATEKSGIGAVTGKGLGVAVVDYDQDGWPDLFVANDKEPNKLFHNKKDGTFSDEALAAGVAFGDDGAARGGMGVDAADYDRSGRPGIVVGNFSEEMISLFHNEGDGLFVDDAPASGVGKASFIPLTFGAFFFDYDLDGLPDLLAANGHLDEEIEKVKPKLRYEQAPLLLRNLGKRKFDDATASAGADFSRPIVGRGAAYGDFDRDGDLDVLLTSCHGAARLYRNDGGNRNHWLTVRTVGTKSNRDGIGATVRVTSAGGAQWQQVHSGSSYCSQSDLALTFGLGGDRTVAKLIVEWPSGAKDTIEKVDADQFVTVKEGEGIVRRTPAGK